MTRKERRLLRRYTRATRKANLAMARLAGSMVTARLIVPPTLLEIDRALKSSAKN